MTRRTVGFAIIGCAGVSACGINTGDTNHVPHGPHRAVSLDYCADQYALKLLDREEIIALSPDAEKSFSYMRDAAADIPQVRARTEEVLALRPTLILRAYGGGPNAPAYFNRAGVKVVQIGYASDLDGVRHMIRSTAAALNREDRGEKIIARMDARLAEIQSKSVDQNALYFTAGGVTTGPGALPHAAINAAGLQNYEATPGWRPIPLEKLVITKPDIAIASFFDGPASAQNAWSAASHPIARQLLGKSDSIQLDGAWTACGGWFIIDAIEALAETVAGMEQGGS